MGLGWWDLTLGLRGSCRGATPTHLTCIVVDGGGVRDYRVQI